MTMCGRELKKREPDGESEGAIMMIWKELIFKEEKGVGDKDWKRKKIVRKEEEKKKLQKRGESSEKSAFL